MAEASLRASAGEVIYDLLAGVFLAPLSAAQVESYRTGPGAEILAGLAMHPALRPHVEALGGALGQGTDAEAVATALNRSYVDLFSGSGGPGAAPPYESAYGGTGRLFQIATGEMEALLSRLSLHIDGRCREPADHLAIELAALAEISRRAGAPGPTHELYRERGELLARLATWVPEFARRCAARDTGFYPAAAALLVALLQQERAHLPATDLA